MKNKKKTNQKIVLQRPLWDLGFQIERTIDASKLLVQCRHNKGDIFWVVNSNELRKTFKGNKVWNPVLSKKKVNILNT